MPEAPSAIPIIPMKPLSEGKTRLARQLTKEQRAELVVGMLRRVIRPFREHAGSARARVHARVTAMTRAVYCPREIIIARKI